MDVLSQRHRLFVDAYAGDLPEAMQLAGYKGTPAQLESKGKEFLGNPNILKAIQERSKYLEKTRTIVADRTERQAMWTSIMRNVDPHRLIEEDEHGIPKPPENIPLPTRLKATELLGKSEADFTEKIDVSGTVTITDIITRANEIEDSELDAIEAEYNEIYPTEEPDTPTPEKTETKTQNDDSSMDRPKRSDNTIPADKTDEETENNLNQFI